MRNVHAAILLAVVVAAGCGGGQLYPNTDVIMPSGLERKTATGFKFAPGGLLASGNMECEGAGELQPLFLNYIAQMQSHGWTPDNSDVQADKAIGSLKKDTRVCSLTFTQANGKVRAVIVVGPAAGK